MRNNSIDILRFIGLAMIIFAHVGPPGILFQLRNFDVPLMVLVSGMAFSLSYKANESYLQYIWKRVKRLVLPVWIFLTGYFLALFLFAPNNPDLTAYKMATSYFLIEGIGYVWIIRVFVLVALVSPFVFKWHISESSNKTYFGLIAIVFIVYEAVRYFSMPLIENDAAKTISLIVYYIVPYTIIFAIGLRIPTLKNHLVINISFVSLALFILLGFGIYIATGSIATTQAFKYPPSIYYFSYALFVASLLWFFREKIESVIDKVNVKHIVLFCAQNSIWIYLWHIPIVKFFDANFAVKYVVAFTVAASITFVQVGIVKRINAHIQNTTLRKNIRALFTG